MKILIVDDHPLVRKGVLSTLSFEEDIEKIIEASNINEAMSALRKERPDLVIVDLYLGDEDGLEIIERARKNKFDTKFLVLTSSLKKEDFNRAEEFGVDGYILKEAFVEDILYAIHVVMRGQRFVDPEILKHNLLHNKKDNHLSALTPRESDVLGGLAKGMSNHQIADELFISEHTVKKHVSNILSKLELEHRTQAALLVNSRMYF